MTTYDELSKEQLIERLSVAEQQLRELSSASEYKQLGKSRLYAEEIPMAFVRANGAISYVNKSLCEINGFTEAEIIGRPITDFVSDDKMWDRELLKEMNDGKSELFRGEHYLLLKNGMMLCFDIVVIAVRDDKGKFLKAIYIFNDISVSKHNERELIDLLDTQKRIADTLMLMMCNETGNYENEILQIVLERYNADRAYIFQFDWKNNCNRNISETVAEGISREIENLQHVPNSSIPEVISFFYEKKPFVANNLERATSSEKWGKDILKAQNIKSIILFPIFISNELWGYLGIDMVNKEKVWDTNEVEWLSSFTSILSVGLGRKFAIDKLDKQKELFDLILDSGSLGYWKIDMEKRKVECSENYLARLGNDLSNKEVDLNSLWSIVCSDDLPNFQDLLENIVLGTTDERSMELRMRNEKGECYWVLSKIVKIEYDEYEKSHLLTVINLNIDRTKQAALAVIEKDAQIKQNERKYSELYHNMNLGYSHNKIVCDESGCVVDFMYMDVNSVFETMIGHSKEELIGVNAISIGHKVSDELLELFGEVALNGVLRHVEYFSEQFMGWYSMSIYSPKQGEFIILFNDIDARRKAHEVVRQSEHKLRTVFENIPVGIVVYDENGDYQSCNAEILRTFDTGYEDPSDYNLVKRMRNFYPDWGGDTALNIDFAWSKELHGIVTDDFKNSDCCYLQLKVFPIIDTNSLGKVTGYLLLIIDETEHKLLEASLREAKEKQEVTNSILSSVLELSQVLPWDCNIPTQTFSCDYDIYHHESQSEPINRKYFCTIGKYIDSIHPDYRERMREVFTDLVAGKRKDFHETYLVHWYNDREYEWIDKQGAVYEYDENGAPKTVIGSSVVITARKRMEQNLLNALDQAEQSNRLKSAFLANMSHEIRTPLNAIVGFSEMLVEVDDAQERREYAEIIVNNNQLLLQLISDILDISKIEAGTLEFVYSNVNVSAVLQEVQMAAQMKVDKSIVKILFEESIPNCVIYSERNRLLQVINNLIANAIKFTSQGEIKLGYRLLDDKTLYFYVKDTGCGIPAADRQNIFGRFVKLNNFVSGTGLGLSICQTIINKMNGKIGVESQEGVGSTFWFTIPYQKVLETTADAPQLCLQRRGNGGVGSKLKPRILIAEDNESNYKLFETILEKNYTLIHAWNGLEAVEMFGSQRPDIILMDLKMPELGGIDAATIIRETSKSIPIIAITAFAFHDDREQALAAGCNDFLTKPIHAKELLNLIDNYLR